MSQLFVSSFLRRVLQADAIVSLGAGAVMAMGGVWLQPWLQLPASLLVTAGLSLFVYAAVVAWMSRRESVPRAALWLVIGCNLAWAVDCVAIAAGPWFAPSLLGELFLGANALTVLLFADLEFLGLRRAGGVPAGGRQLA